MKREIIPLTPEDLTWWRTEIKDARQMRTDIADRYGWKDNLKRYVPKPSKNAHGIAQNEINIGVDFSDVERKKAALFYDTPTVALTVTQDRPVMGEVDPMTGQPQPMQMPNGQPLTLSTVVSWHQELLNGLLGPKHADVKPTILKAIFDCLCPAGVGPVSVGYQVTMGPATVQVPLMTPEGFPVLGPDMMPVMTEQQIEVPIHERWFISRYSPMAALIPASYKDTAFGRAPWLGQDWRKPRSQVRREHHLGDDWSPQADDDTKPYFETEGTDVVSEDAGDPWVTGVDIWYREEIRAKAGDVVHPEKMRHLVLVDGSDEPLVHEDSPHQDFGDDGIMSPDSLEGYPYHLLTLRDLSDSAWIPSDCAVTGALTKELEKFRGDGIKQRANSRRVILFDGSKVPPDVKDKIDNGQIGTFIPVMENALMGGRESIMQEVAQPSLGRENFLTQDIIQRDREKILGISSNQSGATTAGRRTATENSIVQRNSEARFEQERQRVSEWFIGLVQKFDTLVIRYGDARIASQILGPERGQVWAQAKMALAGGYTYDIQTDSGKYLDVEADRRQLMQMYSQVRQDPFINPRPLLKRIAESFGYDPAEFITEPPKPQKELKGNFTFKLDDVNPLNPSFPIVVKLLRQAGWDLNEQDIQLAMGQAHGLTGQTMPVAGVGPDPNAPQPPPGHPGAQPQQPSLSKHLMDETGQMDGPAIDGRMVQ